MRNRQNKLRVGITAGKKVGNAVKRNRARRVIREGFRQVLPQVNSGVDIVFVARARTLAMKSTDLIPVIAKTLRSHGYLAPNPERETREHSDPCPAQKQ
jgi:ribonuclease P protein component